MNESEWLASSDPQRMLQYLSAMNSAADIGESPYPVPHTSDRKLRLFACAASRTYGTHNSRRPDIVAEHADMIARAELWADTGNRGEVRAYDGMWHAIEDSAELAARNIIGSIARTNNGRLPDTAAILRDIIGDPFRPVTLPPSPDVCRRCRGDGSVIAGVGGQMVGYEPRRRCARCQGRGFTSHPWLTPLVVSLAEAAYEERAIREETFHLAGVPCKRKIIDGTLDPFRMALLADALEEAGCFGPLIDHLRSPGPHWRGCWALDLILGRR